MYCKFKIAVLLQFRKMEGRFFVKKIIVEDIKIGDFALVVLMQT
jgi:hypothetical protein